MALPGKREQKEKAQEMLMLGIANVLGYWTEGENPFARATQDADGNWKSAKPLSQEEKEEFGKMLLREADRVAKLFGYDEAWTA
jgi:hypothetical protein